MATETEGNDCVKVQDTPPEEQEEEEEGSEKGQARHSILKLKLICTVSGKLGSHTWGPGQVVRPAAAA